MSILFCHVHFVLKVKEDDLNGSQLFLIAIFRITEKLLISEYTQYILSVPSGGSTGGPGMPRPPRKFPIFLES